MKGFFPFLVLAATLAAGCQGLNTAGRSTALPLHFHHDQSGFTFFLPADWRGYSVLMEQWDGETYSPAEDKQVIVGHGPMMTLRPPNWSAGAPSQEIPIIVFTRAQWDDLHHGQLWPSFLAGGMVDELWHNNKYVFGMSSRYNAGELSRSEEVAKIVEENRAANKMPRSYSE